MKKLLTFLVLTALCLACVIPTVNAGMRIPDPPVNTACRRVIQSQTFNEQGDCQGMTLYLYTDDGVLDTILEYWFSDSEQDFVLDGKFVYTMNEQGLPSSMTCYWIDEGEALPSRKYDYEYDAHGNVTMEEVSWYNTETQTFEFETRHVAQFNEQDFLISKEEIYISWEDELYTGYREEWTYDAQSRVLTYTRYEGGSAKEPYVISRETYTYEGDSEDYATYKLEQYNYVTYALEETRRETATVDGNVRTVVIRNSTDGWENEYERRIFTMDGNTFTALYQSWDGEKGEYYATSENVSTFEEDGNTVTQTTIYRELPWGGGAELVNVEKTVIVMTEDPATGDTTEDVKRWDGTDTGWSSEYDHSYFSQKYEGGVLVESVECYGTVDEWYDFSKVSYTLTYLHDLEKKDAVAPTCTRDGVKEYYVCKECGEAFADGTISTAIDDLDEWKAGDGKIPGAGGKHDLEKVDRVEPTETEDGVKEYYACKNCTAVFEDAEGKTEITDLSGWKTGDGKIAASGTNPGTDDEKNGLSTGIIILIVILALLLLLIIAYIVTYVVWRKKQKAVIGFLKPSYEALDKLFGKKSE